MRFIYKKLLRQQGHVLSFGMHDEKNHFDYVINVNHLMESLGSVYKRLQEEIDLELTHEKIITLHLSTKICININMQEIVWKIMKPFVHWKLQQNTIVVIDHNGNVNDKIANVINMGNKIQDARMLAMLPANLGYPQAMMKDFKKLFKKVATKIKIYSETELKRKGFNLILSVGQSAKNKPGMIVVERDAKHSGPTICIIGKGITFDSGGLSIKTRNGMYDMKYDKIGAIYGAYALLHLMQDSDPRLKNCKLVGIFPFAENAVSENSTRPGDVIKSYSGKTVEILNTDAEGRLILADALAYSKEFAPDLVIDIATLTGFSSLLSCFHSGYFFCESKKLRDLTEKVSYDLGERMIPMITWTDTISMLKSDVADIVNVTRGKCNDSYVAAMFLREFAPKTKWLHIDLAHEHDHNIPEGQGIQTIIEVVNKYIKEKMT